MDCRIGPKEGSRKAPRHASAPGKGKSGFEYSEVPEGMAAADFHTPTGSMEADSSSSELDDW